MQRRHDPGGAIKALREVTRLAPRNRIALELLMLFCPTTAPVGKGGGSGVLLSYCNRPSLFDKM